MPTKLDLTKHDAPGDATAPFVEVRDLLVHFDLRGSVLSRLLGRSQAKVRAVDGVSFTIGRGEVLGLVGESGSGKTTLGRALLGLVPSTSGSIRIGGTELAGRSERKLRPLRRRVQMVFQDPHAALNPAMTIRTAVAHPLRIHKVTKRGEETEKRVRQALETVGLTPPERYLDALPENLSGGQKQRAVMARAAVLDPELLVADEPVSMLDMSVRAKILQLMLDLRDRLGLTYVYITHDLATAKLFCTNVAILYLGKIVEVGPTAEIFASPRHPYTRALVAAIPEPGERTEVPRDLPRGEIPDAVRPPAGCSFHPRCPKAFAPCGWEGRDLAAALEARWAQVGTATYAEERQLVGDLKALDQPGRRLFLRAPAEVEPEKVLRLLEKARDEAPEERFWLGVRTMRTVERGVEVELHDPVAPTLLRAGRAEIACHLYDPQLAPLAPSV
ncbi:peptide/nickel transport system ATP-binding protein [Motilibacter rhizosphaerae]|uniref:Peptide/nickel transport system ATP-binding protein n=1 Tax=Motilibacter rhizosphaerae TaxID=598652 RepID=A0A4Q7NWA1_9ACTN|nr:ABC transporter ATP-binding protein [Motilibacter rhizosphaerae]RZS91487.1 peptide/nickel transport system ATP-binding protein [Motilibacter rhizosphaerae]